VIAKKQVFHHWLAICVQIKNLKMSKNTDQYVLVCIFVWRKVKSEEKAAPCGAKKSSIKSVKESVGLNPNLLRKIRIWPVSPFFLVK